MATLMEKIDDDLFTLDSTVATTLAIAARLQASVAPAIGELGESEINALDLACDAASLIRAHSTKLSLLIINKPFTPSAISTVLRELVAGPLPALASAVELCNAVKYTRAMSEDMQWHAKKVFRELGVLVGNIPLDGRVLSDDVKNGTGKTDGNGSLASTGIVWQACDGVIELKNLGVVGVVIRKAEEYRDLVEDALWELQEWGREGSDADEDERVGSGDENDAQAAVDEIFGPQQHIPSDDPGKIRPRLESSQKRLRLVILMYKAVVKHRFKSLPHDPHSKLPVEIKAMGNKNPGILNTVDEVLDVLKKIPNITDELASAFYGLDEVEIDKRMDECFFTSFAAAELLATNWEGKKDEFTTWANKLKGLLISVADNSTGV